MEYKPANINGVKNITNQKFNRLTVLGYLGKSKWHCVCDCGKLLTVAASNIKNGHSKSCGCYSKELLTKHGLSETSECQTWYQIKRRCYNTNADNYLYYGGRGIKMCEEWKNDFMAFYNDMGKRPSNKHSLDRIDNDGDYCKKNCKWATSSEQSRNKRNNINIEYEGKIYCLKDLCKLLNLSYTTAQRRLNKGWSVSRMINTKPRSRHTVIYNGKDMFLSDLCKMKNISYGKVHHKFTKGMDIHDIIEHYNSL